METEDIHARMKRVAREVDATEDIDHAAERVCAAAVDLLGARTQAGISLAHRGSGIENLGATSESVRRGDALQVDLGEGPCLDAAWEQDQVVATDLRTEQRWPRWGPTMVREYGIRSMLCTQLFTNQEQLGALNIYSTEPDAFDEEAQEFARLLAVHAALTVAAAKQVQHLSIAIDRRTTIGKALGIIMALHDLDDAQAFAVLRRLSKAENRKLYSIAEDVVRTRTVTSRGPSAQPGHTEINTAG